MKEIKIHEPLYFVDVSYLIGGSVKEVQALMDRRHGKGAVDLDDDTDAYMFEVSGTHGRDERFYVWLHKPTRNLLFHETLHLTFAVLRNRGVEYAEECEDAFAYWGGWMFDRAAKAMKL